MNWDEKLLHKMVDEKYVSVQKHPTTDLYIYNYTPKTQFDWVWNEITLQARGLILDGKENVVARPFPKFFSTEQLEQTNFTIPNENFEALEKFDGSLGIMYWANDQPYIATRGSFISEQAIEANKILQEKYDDFIYQVNSNWTYLFEIIYPENRIVVDYGNERKLVLLAIIETATGKEIDLSNAPSCFEVVKKYDGVKDWKTITDQFDGEGREGFVIRFESGFRLKIKYEDYKRLHRIICNVSEKTVWEMLRDQQSIEPLLQNVPDEFYNWLKDTAEKLNFQYKIIEEYCAIIINEILKKVGPNATKKDKALEILKYPKYSSVMFACISGKQTWPIIWKMIKPKANKPFREDV